MSSDRAASSSDTQPRRPRRYLAWLRNAVVLAAAAGLFWLVVLRASLPDVVAALRSLKWSWAAAALGGYLLTALLRGIYLKVISALPARPLVLGSACAATELLGTLAPGPARDAVLAGLVRYAVDVPTTHAIKAAVAVRILEVTVRSALAAVAIFLLPQTAWVRYSLGPAAVAMAAVGVGIIVWPHVLVGAVRSLVAPFRRLARASGRLASVDDFLDRLLRLEDRAFLRSTAPAAVGIILLRWVVFVFVMFSIYRSVGAGVSYFQAAYIALLLGYVTALPMRPPADLGTADITMVGLLMSLGWAQGDAATVAIASRCVLLVTIAVAGLVGLGGVLALSHRGRGGAKGL